MLPILRKHEYNGTLSSDSFKEFLLELDLESETNKYLKALDPNNTDVITISSIISLFTAVTFIQETLEGENLLQKLYNQLNSEIE